SREAREDGHAVSVTERDRKSARCDEDPHEAARVIVRALAARGWQGRPHSRECPEGQDKAERSANDQAAGHRAFALAQSLDIAERYSRSSAFLNVPYDARYENLFLAWIAGLCSFGLTPRATLELPGPTPRLDRILDLIAACRYSFHDLSRTEVRRGTPRFNMPFELGLVVGRMQRQQPKHEWFVFEARRFRLLRS